MIRSKDKNYDELVKYITDNQESLYRFAYTYVKNQQEALDIVQESIYKALSSINTLKNSQHMKSWLYRIIINTSITHIRKTKKVLPIDQINDKPDCREHDLDRNIDLHEAIDKLDENQKTIVVLRYFEDMKIDDIAKTIDCNVSTVKSRLYTALDKLKIIMNKGV
ncbi:sigma-70 family RNA polymerase sigma factor [Tepidibacter aestuarii]|uniref:sigma-70 family RNA polymerase sigma factor n=1 Tax=Tepidibacter aestuarii TaxID=2925782 RepID=UPI0020BDE16B|nr:sigma-70 family RNA polymerase sigma factor [Tepidibacter aestuarii]CAH2215441.1 RNA polymerase ECF(extracytoplasmic function)-type lysozyme-sensitive sigma factor (sigma(V)) [Tepidibacter aestuarii]